MIDQARSSERGSSGRLSAETPSGQSVDRVRFVGPETGTESSISQAQLVLAEQRLLDGWIEL